MNIIDFLDWLPQMTMESRVYFWNLDAFFESMYVANMETVCGSRSKSDIPMVLMDGIGLNITFLSLLMSLLRALLYSSFKLSLGICDGLGCNVIYIFQQTSSAHFLFCIQHQDCLTIVSRRQNLLHKTL